MENVSYDHVNLLNCYLHIICVVSLGPLLQLARTPLAVDAFLCSTYHYSISRWR